MANEYFEMPGLTYELSGKIRDRPVSREALEMMMAAAYAVDPRLEVVVVSAGQDQSGKRRTGSHRHDVDDSGYSQTADVALVLNGKRLTPTADKAIYRDFLQNAAAAGFTGLGHYGWGVHVGSGSPAAWGPNKKSSSLDSYFGDAIDLGRKQAQDGVGRTLIANYRAGVPTPKTGIGGPPEPTSKSALLSRLTANPDAIAAAKLASLPKPPFPQPRPTSRTALDAIMGVQPTVETTAYTQPPRVFDPSIPRPAPLPSFRRESPVAQTMETADQIYAQFPLMRPETTSVAEMYEGIIPPKRTPEPPATIQPASLQPVPRTPSVQLPFPKSFPRATDPAWAGETSDVAMGLSKRQGSELALLQPGLSFGDALNDRGPGSLLPPLKPKIVDTRGNDYRIAEQRAEQELVRNRQPPPPPLPPVTGLNLPALRPAVPPPIPGLNLPQVRPPPQVAPVPMQRRPVVAAPVPAVRTPIRAPIPAQRRPVQAPQPMPRRRSPLEIVVNGGQLMPPPVPMPRLARSPDPTPAYNNPFAYSLVDGTSRNISDASQRNRENSSDGSVTGTRIWDWIMNG